MQVLLADDDDMMRLLLEEVLKSLGYSVDARADGAAAWAAYEAAPARLAVLDWQMPGLDGLEVCRRIRAHPQGVESYILVVTARDGVEDLQSVLDAGADDYLSKPVTPKDVAARLRIAERRMETAAARRTAEAELRKARYLAGIGEMSIALQHEINNPLAALLTNASLVSSGLVTGEEATESLAAVQVQANRIAEIVRRLQTLGAPQSTEYAAGQRMVDLRPDASR